MGREGSVAKERGGAAIVQGYGVTPANWSEKHWVMRCQRMHEPRDPRGGGWDEAAGSLTQSGGGSNDGKYRVQPHCLVRWSEG